MTIGIATYCLKLIIYCQPSTRVKILSRLREKVSPHVAESSYKTMIRPILLYCYSLQLSLPQGVITKLQRIQDRAARTVNPGTMTTSWDSIEKTQNTRVAINVFKSLHNLLPTGLNSYFKMHHHKINTRGNGIYIFLPKIRTETGKSPLPTKGHAFIIDWKNLFARKHPSYYSKRDCNYLRLCRFQGRCIGH